MDTKKWAEELLAPADITINGNRPWDITVKNPELYHRVLNQDSLGLGESYMDGWWEAQSLDQFFYHLFSARLQDKFKVSFPLVLEFLKGKLFNLQVGGKSFEVGKKHYDLGNDFFVDMLSKSMAYSCGYWLNSTDLDAAQFAKFDLICRKLNLQKGPFDPAQGKPQIRILDIGSGWGAFAKYAAQTYGVSVLGVTISKEQAEFATQSCKGLPVEFRFQDYHNLNEKFDHIVSVGMFEHVGPKNYKSYLQVAKRCLKENGLFLLHTIGSARTGDIFDPWMNKYIFPNAFLPSLKQISEAAENLFIIEDVHNIGSDYDKTLMAWHQNFEANWPKYKDKYGERFYRMWRYYLLACAAMFRARTIELWQVVLSPNGVKGGYKTVR